MATATLIPVEEYLRTTYRPDRDFIDGELRERNRGERPHATLQVIFAAIFREHRRQWLMVAMTEQRVQTSALHYRIADVCVVRSSDPVDPIVRTPPVLCIEILSKGDSLGELQERVDDYKGYGRGTCVGYRTLAEKGVRRFGRRVSTPAGKHLSHPRNIRAHRPR